MKNYCLLLILPVSLLSCKEDKKKETDPSKDFISVVSLVREQVAQVDTSLFSIMKVVERDSLRDTSYIRREDFAREAKDFLEIPDLSDPKVAKKYKAEALHDESIKRVIITYLPIEPDKEEVKKQEVLLTPVLGADAEINNIIIVREISTRDSFLQKKMLWQVDRSFQIVTTSQKPGKPEITTVTKVSWNENEGF